MKIKLALPPPPLYPNYRSLVPWPKAKATKNYRADAAVMARIAMGPGRPLWNRAWARICFYHPSTRHYRDPDSMASSLKAVWDGFQDCGLLNNDRRLAILPIEQDVDADRPRVEIEICEGYPPHREDDSEPKTEDDSA